jgi:tetratricopeptide (TPR) repeat protein
VRGNVGRAQVFLTLGDTGRALVDSRDAMTIEPANPFALIVRGNVYPAKGDLNRAIDDYTAAIHFEPFAQYFHERGVAYRMKGDREHAIDDFKYAVHLLPKDTPRLARRTQGARDRHVRLRPYKATQGHAQFA